MTVSATYSAPAALAARADAQRNRALVLAAAQRAFAERGLAVSLAEVARRAGVGAGTVYRHFPTKSELLEAVMQQRVDRLARLAAARAGAQDPGAAFFEFCADVVSSTPRNQALCEMVQSDDGWPRTLMAGAGVRFHQALEALLLAAQRQGAVRADIVLADVLDVFTGCVAIQRNKPAGSELARAAVILLDALRATSGGAGVAKLRVASDTRDETGPRNETSTGPRCPICGAELDAPGIGRPRRYCSAACRQKAHRSRVAVRAMG
ncbi:TetR/AcrR family transcriptional regulator [Nocardia xishanensis]|uniref:TetR/AcrR family transcriptional regulator n=1 Tax=Nocardia xishanensis TaxID=238964 RepID=UPI000829669E|nr:TetR/AcrR family transcriptional regulator [Nocardia xishanensis]